MKKEYEKIIWKVQENMKKVPLAVSGLGAGSSTLQSYISAYRDMEPCWNWFLMILDSIKNIEIYDKILKRNDIDRDEIEASRDFHKERLEKAVQDLDEFIQGRAVEGWK